jgi:hypothetical protein
MTALGLPERHHDTFDDLRAQATTLAAKGGAGLRRVASAKTLAAATWAVALVGTAIVGVLALRVWLQLTGDTSQSGIVGFAYDLSGMLAGPFRSLEPSTTVKDSGILEFSSLVAIEAYLIATMLAMTLLFSLRLTLFAAPRMVRVVRSTHRRHHASVAATETPNA